MIRSRERFGWVNASAAFVFFLAVGSAHAADPAAKWVKVFESFQGQHEYAAIPTADGGYAAAYPKYSADKKYASLCVLKLDAAGAASWEKEFGERPADKSSFYHDAARDIIEVADGYVVAGSRAVPHAMGASAELWVVKLDKTGGKVWEAMPKPTGGHSFPFHQGLAIRATPDGGFALGASCMYAGQEANLALFKLDASGALRWEKRLSGSQPSSAGFECSADGTIIVAWGGDSAVTVARFDQAGKELSGGRVAMPAGSGLSGSISVASVSARPDGGLFCAVNEDNGNGFLFRCDAGLKASWVLKLPAALLRGIGRCADGGILVAASDTSTRLYRITIVKVGSDGKLAWRKAWAHATLPGISRANTAYQAPDGGYLVFGTVSSPGGGTGTVNVLLKTDAAGSVK